MSKDFDYSGYDQPDWGGYGEKPIAPETVELAEALFHMLRNTPDDAPGGDGSICYEWRHGDDILCLDVEGDTFRVYGRIGGTHYHGAPCTRSTVAVRSEPPSAKAADTTPDRKRLPTWFVWLDMVATLTLAALMMACMLTGKTGWGVAIATVILAIRAIHLAWSWRLVSRDRDAGSLNGRAAAREKRASSAIAALMSAAVVTMVVFGWQGGTALRNDVRLDPRAYLPR